MSWLQRFLLTFCWICMGFLMPSHAGTLGVPSKFPLHRPLNPALIVGAKRHGIAYGEGTGNRNLANTAPSNCEFRGFSKCIQDDSDYRLLYTHLGNTYFQAESLRTLRKEQDDKESLSINFNQFEWDSVASFAVEVGPLSIGLSRKDTELRVREFTSDITSGQFTRYLKEQSIVHGAGFSLNMADWLFISGYYETPAITKSQNSNGSNFERVANDGFRGGAIGFQMFHDDKERSSGISLEVFQMVSRSVEGGDISLSGMNVEFTVLPFVFYALVLNDENNNYFRGELLQDYSVSFANGIGINGENFQFLLGRDPRFFLGLDGGVIATLGIQF